MFAYELKFSHGVTDRQNNNGEYLETRYGYIKNSINEASHIDIDAQNNKPNSDLSERRSARLFKKQFFWLRYKPSEIE